MIEIKKLNFRYENSIIFDDLALTLHDGLTYTLVGKNGIGKTTLVKILSGVLKSNYEVYLDNKKIPKKQFHSLISVIFEKTDENFMFDNVIDELKYPLLSLGLNTYDINTRIENITSILNISYLLDKKINTLTISEKEKLTLALALVTNPKILIMDNALSFINKEEKIIILKFLKKLDLIILNVTNDIEDTLYGDNIIILGDKKVIINDKKEIVFLNEEIFNSNNIHLPFIIDLSIKLKYYSLLDKLCYSYKEVVDSIWK